MEPVVYIQFAGGPLRPVFEEVDGRQFVVTDEGEQVFGVWYIPPNEDPLPLVVDVSEPVEEF